MILDCFRPVSRKRNSIKSLNLIPSRNSFFTAYSRARRSFFNVQNGWVPGTTRNSIGGLQPNDARSMLDITEPSSMEERIRYLRSNEIQFVEVIGGGCFSEIYRCRFITPDPSRADFAVKRVNLKDKRNKNFTRKFLPREILIHSTIQHENIAEYINTLMTPTDCYLLMEYVEHKNLFDHCKNRGRVNMDHTYQIARQLLSAVEYLHSKDIVHRDIKCENVIFSRYEPHYEIKLIDFGFAKRLGRPGPSIQRQNVTIEEMLNNTSISMPDLTSTREPLPTHLTKTFCGSLAYVAPEMLNSFEPYDPKKTDVWSFGVVLYVIATHRMPFKESLGIKSLRKQVNSNLTWPKDFRNHSFMHTISRILDKYPETRILTTSIPNLGWFKKMKFKHDEQQI